MIWLSLVFNCIGLTAIAAAMESHRRRFPRTVRRFHPASSLVIGVVSQAIALALALSSLGVAAGIVLWAVGWAVCGLTLSLLLAFLPGARPPGYRASGTPPISISKIE